ncbi:MAG: 3D domain-containing protein [Bacteriovorax sp.]|nr:3D domain-containing protein [Bacteriovorax sp.]
MPKSLFAIFSLFLLISCASAKHLPDFSDPLNKDTFSFREPTSNDISSKITLWGTYYYLPQLSDSTGEFALRDMNSMELGPRLGLLDWCNSAMEGSVRILDSKGIAKTYNYAGITNSNSVDCKKIFKIDVSRTKFREAKGPYGDGLDDYILAPYRTLATDGKNIAPGTVIYIPQARGAKIVLKNGREIIHDGYFFAGDTGGAIKENHIDVFIGIHTNAPFFPWIKSNQTKTFEAFVISDKKIISDLLELHTAN